MSEMIERVAKAMSVADSDCDLWDAISEDGDGCGYLGKNEYRLMARAAIEAMREPTGKMVKAACGAMSPAKRPTPDRVSSAQKHRIRYQAMIDAALTKSSISPDLDKAIQDELDHPPASILKED